MAVFINTNVDSLIAMNNLDKSLLSVNNSMRRLSSGLRINSAQDDPAGLAIATRMEVQISGMGQASNNINEGISLLQTADKGMANITDRLQRIRALSVQAANGAISSTDRQALDDEVQQLKDGILQIALTTNFNNIALLDGSVNQLQLQVGANANQILNIPSIQNMQIAALGSSGAGSRATGTATLAGLSAGDLTLDGVAIGASVSGSSIGDTASSALEIAAAINMASTNSGVSATATTTLVGNAPSNNATIGDFILNGVLVSTEAAGVANLANAINNAAGTGVTASVNTNGGLTLTASNGENINIELTGTAVNSSVASSDRAAFIAATGLPDASVGTQASSAVAAVPGVPAIPAIAAVYDSHGNLISPAVPAVPGIPGKPYQPPVAASYATTTGEVTLTSNDTAGIQVGGNSPGSAGFTSGLNNQLTVTIVPGIASLNVLTQIAAQRAITSADSAILMVTNARAQIGSVENRLTAAGNNSQTSLLNLASSLSVIQDTNFASETTNLSKAKILQEVGTAMLTHANTSAQLVMTLLR